MKNNFLNRSTLSWALASLATMSLSLIFHSSALAQVSPVNSSSTTPTYLGVNAANDEQSSFTPNNTGVQSAQLTPSLSTPFVSLISPPETATSKNAVPANISKLLKEKKYPEALNAIDTAIKNNPRNIQLHFVRSRTLIDMGKLEQARLELISITEKYPELPEPYNNLAVLYASAGKLEAARENLEMSLKLAPGDSIAMHNLADVYTRLAAGHYKKAYQLNPRLSDAPRKQKLAESITSEK